MTKYILKSISYLIIIITVVFAMLMVGVKFFGINVYTVLSGSMEPKYRVGSLVYVIETSPDELKEGDVITFKITDKVVATHRIVEINELETGKRTFHTKGDANEYIDENPVESNHIIGKSIFTIPYLGYVASFMQTKPGKLITFGISILLAIVVLIIDSITDEKKNKIKL